MKFFLLAFIGAFATLSHAQGTGDGSTLSAEIEPKRIEDEPLGLANPEQSFPHSISAKVLMIDYGIASENSGTITNGIEVAYLRRFTELFSLAVPVKVGVTNDPETLGNKRSFVGADAIVQAGYDLLGDRVRPYAMAGAGFTAQPGYGSDMHLPVGAGVRVRLTDAAYLTGQYEFRKGLGDAMDNSQIGVGLLFNLGRSKFNPEFWDSDGDGVMDHIDECPDKLGTKQMKGCPDTDGDGINDAADPCPLHYGTAKEGGCPDRDGDGVGDPHDKCPGVFGLAERDGCPLPDKDGDGVGDDVDECPDLPGRLNGCPDTDADGVTDQLDNCPKQAGPKATGGCPDRDDDGVADKDDNCPLLPGKLNGCPDRDNDGFDDAADRCPNIAGEHEGCPEIMRSQRQLFEFAVNAIRFENASASLTNKAFENLTGLADILERYPDYELRIMGHADYEENVADRDNFSRERAKSCAEYIISRGIDASRLHVDGVGAGQPIRRDGTLEQRSVNQRVEFDLFTAEE